MLCGFLDSHGQEKKASIGLGVGGGATFANELAGTNDSGPGVNFYINGMYNVNENIAIGLEYNGNASVIFGSNSNSFDFKPTVINGFLAKGKYLFDGDRAKPFVGLMLGAYNITPGEVEFAFILIPIALVIEFEKLTTFGFAPEFGVELGAFQLATSVHFPGKYKAELPDGNGGNILIETRFTIWQFTLGWNIGFGNK